MKKAILFTVVLILFGTSTFAQLKINQYGRIGLGIDPHPGHKLLLKGSMCLTTFPEIPAPLNSWAEMVFYLGTGDPLACIGAEPQNKIAFWSSNWQTFNRIYVKSVHTVSDTSVKTDIEPLDSALYTLSQLDAYTYKLKSDSGVEAKSTMGTL